MTADPTDTGPRPALDDYRARCLEAALELASVGVHTFVAGVHRGADGQREFRFSSSWGQAASTDPNRIRRDWESAGPGSVLCVACGPSGLVAVDLDTKHGQAGPDVWRALIAQGAAGGTPVQVRTPSGGIHMLYRADSSAPVASMTGWRPGIDIKAAGGQYGGFVVTAPSRDHRGDYVAVGSLAAALRSGSLPRRPDILLTREGGQELSPAPVTAIARLEGGPVSPREMRPFTREQAESFCRPAMTALYQAPRGAINDALNAAACTMSHFVGVWPEWSREAVTEWLVDAQRAAWVGSGGTNDGDYSAAHATIRSGLGQANDPWRALPVAPSPFVLADQVVPRPGGSGVAEADPDEVARLLARFLTTKQLRELPPADPLVAGLIDRCTIGTLFGPTGSLKSFLSLDLACRVSLGWDWAGRHTKPGKVAYIVAEGAGGFRKRVQAWEDRHDIEVADLAILPAPVQVASNEWAALVELARREQWALIVLDTRAQISVGLDENAAKDTAVLLGRCAQLRDAAGAHVLLVHHSGWEVGRQRGSSSMPAGIDTELAAKAERVGPDLRTTVTATKVKDDEAGVKFAFRADIRELGYWDDLGRPATSLVLEFLPDAKPEGEDVTGDVPSGVAYTAGAMALITVMKDLAPVGSPGLTHGQLCKYLGATDKRHPKVHRPVSESTVTRQIKTLLARGEIARVQGQQRYVILPDEDRAQAVAAWQANREQNGAASANECK